eukprot:CAMPEP_0113330546 /NCGR_PEP_ID=MMETSP0010_2-20120614/21711_1 /TAXON_ID=216773 ORGANISM="Corethron hystrix, Strain 308" /NCGR_SAMPLE_ID=MMETSP0010_2 /ASSEMBLY_ACC=CAM_ASM_000155 /LENGTH=199 /DNA_ID=CAMNT_0000193149 /DNA_START=332 /DNA_END=932 /DNA_ORIENTATION=- /assembly_acc=CAM_ASM_000155
MSIIQNSIKGSKSSEDTGEVDHTYHDYSKIPSNGIADALAISSCDLFPMKLQMILSSPEYEHIASWMPHGRCWKIHRRKDFELVVLPKFFEHRKYDSFIRQVNGWAFKRITRGVDKGSYYNEFFLRGLPHVCRNMIRQKRSIRKRSNPQNEPDFYEISRHCPLPELNQNNSLPVYARTTAPIMNMTLSSSPSPVPPFKE